MSSILNDADLTRRSFLKWGAAVAGLSAAAAGGLISTDIVATAASTEASSIQGGKWVAAACWHHCGGRCLNKALVVDGVVVRQKTDDNHPDTPEYPQQRGCLRGRSSRQLVLGADRLKYPMKRKNWEPGGGDRSLRGRDEWVRISWDEALDYVAAELKRIKNNYGNDAFLASGYNDARATGSYAGWLLNAYGGCQHNWGQASQGGIPVVATKMKGLWTLGMYEASDRFDILNAKLIVMWAMNPAWSHLGNPTYYYLQAKKAGAKIIMVDSWFSPTMQALADQYIPVRPGTDTALLAALAYHMITNDLQDQAFLDKCTIGFDAEHMPEGSETQENFKDYILGKYDGIPKTPEWAANICGTPPADIRQLAEEISTTKPMTFKSSMAPARTHNGGQFAQMFFAVGWMTGNVGYSGAEVTMGSSMPNSPFGGPPLVSPGPTYQVAPQNPICLAPRGSGTIVAGKYDPTKNCGVAYAEMWTSILDGEYTDFSNGKKKRDIQCIYKIDFGAPLNQIIAGNKGYEAYRKVEFAVAADLFMTTDCLFSDIVLPLISEWENSMCVPTTIKEIMLVSSQVIEPMFECKSQGWIEEELAKRLGIADSDLKAISHEQARFNSVANSVVMKEDGSEYEPLVEITEADLIEYGMEGTPHSGRITLAKLLEDGIYQVERSPGDKFGFVAYTDFRNDPLANPVNTPSGKFEIFSESLPGYYDLLGLSKISAIPKYTEALDGYENTFSDWENQIKGEYPFQLITIHQISQAHSTFHNVKSLRELFPNGLIISNKDARELDVERGDTVLVESPYGKVLCRANPSPRVMPGVVILGQGNWTDLDEDGIDRGANTNSLSGPIMVGEGQMPFNTLIVAIKKWSGDPALPNYLRPQRVFN